MYQLFLCNQHNANIATLHVFSFVVFVGGFFFSLFVCVCFALCTLLLNFTLPDSESQASSLQETGKLEKKTKQAMAFPPAGFDSFRTSIKIPG